MSTTAIKLVAGAGMALFILILIGILSLFAYHKLTAIEPVVYVIMGLITTLMGMLTALAGHASASAQSAAGSATFDPSTIVAPAIVLPTSVNK
jgi:hypothetical protein